MPRVWSSKDESQFMFLKRRELKRGRSGKEAAEIAARAVNAQQRKEGRYTGFSAGDTGNPNTSLEERKISELRNIATNLNINISSKMRKAELVTAIRSRRQLGAVPMRRPLPRNGNIHGHADKRN